MYASKMIRKPADLSDVCRLCLQLHKQLIPIFDDQLLHDPAEMSLSSKIMACVSIKIINTDRGPHKICPKCVNMINSWYQFKEDCKAVDACIQKYLSEVVEQNAPLPKMDDLTSNVCENSSFSEISLSSFDSVLEKNLTLKSNLFSILDVILEGKTPQVDCESDKITDTSSTAATSSSPIIDTTSHQDKGISVTNLEDEAGDENPLELNSNTDEQPKKRRKGYTCELCNVTFAKFAQLVFHDDTLHQDVFRKFSCPTCGRLFISENRLKSHELSHREKLHKCTTCEKLFASAKSLQVHSRLHSGKYKCTTCGYVTTAKLYLEEHLLKHVGNETVYVCKTCSATFTSSSSLRRHENIHLRHGGRIYKCSICGLVTRRRCELQNHMVAHYAEETTNEYKCHQCQKSFKYKKTLRVHMIRHDEGQFICSICKKKIYSKYELIQHEETHGHAKKFSCFHCDQKFSYRSTLMKHIKSNVPRVRSDIPVQ